MNKAFDTQSKTALTVFKTLLQEIVYKFRLPLSIGSDNKPVFTSFAFTFISASTGKEGLKWNLEVLLWLLTSELWTGRMHELDH